MVQWRRPRWIVLALLALLALVSPSLTWACPVTGRTGSAATVCDHSMSGAAASDSATMACCKQMTMQSGCCKALPPLPEGESSTNSLASSHADTASALAQLSKVAHATGVVIMPPLAPLVIEPPHGFAAADSDTSLLSQSTPPVFAGRAPPLS